MELDVYKLDFKNLQNYAEKLSNYAENSIVQYQFSLSRVHHRFSLADYARVGSGLVKLGFGQ